MVGAATPSELEAFTTVLAAQPAVQRMLEERWLPEPYSLSDLERCAPGTLGHAFREYLVANGLTCDFFPPIDRDRADEFIRLRMYQTHDYWHVLSGFDSSDVGELGIVGFYLGQLHTHFGEAGLALSVFTGVLASSLILNASVIRPAMLPEMVASFHDGYQRGCGAAPLLAVPWETRWDTPVEELRVEFGIAAPPENARTERAA